ncbi:30S ribosomal protein S12 methylthiotransferase RimO [Persicobacter psychrovividus]|uniref:30S ribosomal protein S12 methylthiotransferase RimO n=1 Tax=Persicobacter psychrovividus TaxID=387638 RepID=UPI002FCDF1CD
MKAKGLKKDKVNVITLGCSKNLVDTEVMITQLKGNDIDVEHESQKNDANIVIINTCGFIANAKQESIDMILRFGEEKEAGNIDKLFVTGCLSQRYKEELTAEIPQVDAFFGTNEVPALLQRFKADYKSDLLGDRITTTSNHYSYLKIAEGCDRPCSFCAIPLIRGKHVSQPIEKLVTEAENLAKNGTKELLLIAQDLTYYGLDIYKKRNLSDLLKRLSDVNGIDWIRLHYAYPAGFPMDVIDVMAERDNICNYLDIPLQHGSSNVLKAMRRGIDREKTERLITDIRERVPDIAIRTTMIAGHPGETEADHQEMLRFVEKMRFERLGIFTYSHEDNTHAFGMEDLLSQEEKQRRADEVMQLQEGISFELNQAKVGRTFKTMIDRKEGGYWIGRTEFDSPEVDNEVLIPADKHLLRLGDFANIEIEDASEFDLFGKPV